MFLAGKSPNVRSYTVVYGGINIYTMLLDILNLLDIYSVFYQPHMRGFRQQLHKLWWCTDVLQR